MTLTKRKRVVLADFDKSYRDWFRETLTSNQKWELIAEAETGDDAIEIIDRLQPDLVVLSPESPVSGYQVIGHTKRNFDVKFLIITWQRDSETATEAFSYGADGFCTKSSTRTFLLLAMSRIMNGERPCYRN